MKTHNSIAGRVFWAILILGGGVLLTLSALGIGVESSPYKIIGSLLLLGVAVSSLVKLRFFFTFLPLAGIAYLWRDMLGFPEMSIWPLLGAGALLGIGLSVLFHKKHSFTINTDRECCEGETKDVTPETVDAEDSVTIDCTFGEKTKYIHSNNLKRVFLSGSFAQVKAYFDQCKVDPEGLTIQVNGSFCGLEIVVPRTWAVESKVSSFAAAVNDSGRETTPSEAQVTIVGTLNFGELKIVRV